MSGKPFGLRQAESQSRVDQTVEYMRKQPEHHRKMTFKEEFMQLMKKHAIAYDERYLWD
jgi:putative transposase